MVRRNVEAPAKEEWPGVCEGVEAGETKIIKVRHQLMQDGQLTNNSLPVTLVCFMCGLIQGFVFS